jgi:hypothetical protein
MSSFGRLRSTDGAMPPDVIGVVVRCQGCGIDCATANPWEIGEFTIERRHGLRPGPEDGCAAGYAELLTTAIQSWKVWADGGVDAEDAGGLRAEMKWMRVLPLWVAVLSACTSAVGGGSGASEPVAGLPAGPSALQDPFDPSFPEPVIDPDAIVRVLPADAIPAIDTPAFISVDELDLPDTEPVIALEIDGDARAYPVGVLTFHEIVNDTVGGVPVSITYCPLCNSAVTYERTVQGAETTFGVSGRLYNSALVMYDRATQTMWTHFDGRAVVGALAGERLDPVSSPLLGWGDFKAAYPDGLVLDPARTGFPGRERSYFSNPYQGYDEEGTRTLFPTDGDDRLDAKERVVALTVDDRAAAWQLEALIGSGPTVTPAHVAGADLVILWRPGQASGLETSETGTGRDVGSVAVFSPIVDGRTLTLSPSGDGYMDAQTGSRWDITGRAVSGELAGTQLERVPHLDTFWFAWSSYRPDSALETGTS